VTVYVVERVALKVNEYESPAGFADCDGEAGPSWTPAAAFSDRAAAEATAARMTDETRREFHPALFGGYELPATPTELAALIRRHGLTPPVLPTRSTHNPAVVLRQWWSDRWAELPAGLKTELWELVLRRWPLYRVVARPLED
jgi:hypothetical protein